MPKSRQRRRPQNGKARGYKVDRYNEHETVFKSAESPYKRKDKYGRVGSTE